MKIIAFGKKVDREKAYEIIINDFIGDIVHAHNTDTLENLLLHGWTPLDELSDQQLEDFIDTLCIENQPGGKI